MAADVKINLSNMFCDAHYGHWVTLPFLYQRPTGFNIYHLYPQFRKSRVVFSDRRSAVPMRL
jgi:hypothetical protein